MGDITNSRSSAGIEKVMGLMKVKKKLIKGKHSKKEIKLSWLTEPKDTFNSLRGKSPNSTDKISEFKSDKSFEDELTTPIIQ